jgi:integrase
MFTVRDLTRSFLANLDVKVKLGETEPSTRAWYKAALDKLNGAAGDFPAAELRAVHLVSVEFTTHFCRVLKALYRWACEEDVCLLTRDPFRKLKPPPCGERNRILSRAEMVRLYRAASPTLRRLLFVLRHTIARPGEIRRIRWGQIQWDGRRIEWRKFKGKKRRGDGVKLRTIPLDRPTLRLLKNLHRNRGNPGPMEPVWLDRDAKEWTANAVRCQMRAARERAGLDQEGVEERVVCYTLRHTSATEATRAGVKGRTLSDIMGHANSRTTDRYLHLAGDDLVEGIDRLAAARPRKA